MLEGSESVDNRIRYTGQQYDEISDQYYLRARYYNPVVGRFLQEDVYQGDGLNLYAYCGNNPVAYYDPSGYTLTPNSKYDTSFIDGDGGDRSGELTDVYNSIKDSPKYPEGFQARKNGTTRNTVKNKELLEQLRELEAGTWKKVYKDGYNMYGEEISIHYFQSESGKVFNVKVKSGWSN